jgi:signal transduction histidine kinase
MGQHAEHSGLAATRVIVGATSWPALPAIAISRETARRRRFGVQPAFDASIAFLASAGFFLLTDAIPIRGHVIPIVALGCVYVYTVLLAAGWRGPLYAVPLAIAGGLGFDSFYIPPTREFGASDWQSWLAVAVYISVGVLIGVVGGQSRRRAEVSEHERGRLAEDQAAVRRVATLVAQGVPANELFHAVVREVGTIFGADFSGLIRHEDDASVTPMATWAAVGEHPPVPARWSSEPGDPVAMIAGMDGPARVDDWTTVPGPIAAFVRGELGVTSSVGSPIVVDGRLWGGLAVHSKQPAPLPPDTERRLMNFTELVATAIANTDARDQLTASRARLLTAGDEARRCVVRDLHDGAQQRLVHMIMTLKLAQRALQEDDDKAESLVGDALVQAVQANAELRELVQGILPSVLTRGGLRAGIDTVVERLDLPVEVDLPAERFPAEIEASVYFVVAEALTNVMKHSHGRHAEVTASSEDRMLRVQVRDDGIGGADPDGAGLVGLRDRVTALGGHLEVDSPAGGGTLLTARLPLAVVER